MALIVITHDLALTAGLCDRIAVMYAGRIVEAGDAGSVLGGPRHPYTHGLLGSLIRVDRPRGGELASIEGASPRSRCCLRAKGMTMPLLVTI